MPELTIWSNFGLLEAVGLTDGYVDLLSLPGVRVELRYATRDNFTGEVLYDAQTTTAHLHKLAADKLEQASRRLQVLRKNWSLLVLDALRPRSVQRKMWDHVKGTSQEIYVANPDHGSLHNFGLAVDLTLADESGTEVDMGTPFDSFQELAQPRWEEKFLESGELSRPQAEHRQLLRKIMTDSGFQTIPHEWWHFNAVPFSEAKANYQIIE